MIFIGNLEISVLSPKLQKTEKLQSAKIKENKIRSDNDNIKISKSNFIYFCMILILKKKYNSKIRLLNI